MKLFKFERPIVVRVDVFVKGKCKTFSIDESDAEKVSNELKNMLENKNYKLKGFQVYGDEAIACFVPKKRNK